MTDDLPEGLVDDERAALILDRAARLDAGRHQGVDLNQLRAAALEAGISSTAFEAAIAEVEALAEEAHAAVPAVPSGERDEPPGDEPPGDEPRWWTLLRRVGIGGGGLALGLLPAFLQGWFGLDEGGAGIFTLVIAVQAVLYLVIRHRKDHSVLDFELDMTSLWTGFTLASMIVWPEGAEEVAGVMSVVWVITALLGGFLVWVRSFGSDDPSRLPERSGPTRS